MKKIKINDEIYVGDSDKQLKDYLSDTGWINCTLSNSKFIANWFETRKIGDMVMITAQLNNPSQNTISNFELIGTTPYPPKEEFFTACRVFLNTNNATALIYVNKLGEIYCVNSPISNPVVQFSFTYFVN